MLRGASDSCGWPYGANGTGMPSISTVERDARRGLRPRMPKLSARSWLPVPLLSGAFTPGMRLSTSRAVVAPLRSNSSRRTTSRAPGCSNTLSCCASASQSPTTVEAPSSTGAPATGLPIGCRLKALPVSCRTCRPLPRSNASRPWRTSYWPSSPWVLMPWVSCEPNEINAPLSRPNWLSASSSEPAAIW
ncbi:hypothetical protein D3C80_1492530 [compost metagenome]